MYGECFAGGALCLHKLQSTMKITYRTGLAALLVVGACSAVLLAAEAPKEVPKTLNAAELAGATLIIPSPGEILSTLKEAKDSDWAAAAEARAKGITPVEKMDSTQAAVLLGRRTAEAFLALEAKDADLLNKASAQILDSARKLGASEGILAQGKDISDLAAAEKWGDIYSLLDGVFLSAQSDLKEVEDDDSLTIASASGWLTGIGIFADQVSGKYSEGAGKALRQGDLAKSLNEKLAALSAGAKDQASVKAMIAAFAKIQPLVTVDQDAAVSEASVKEIASIANAALASLK